MDAEMEQEGPVQGQELNVDEIPTSSEAQIDTGEEAAVSETHVGQMELHSGYEPLRAEIAAPYRTNCNSPPCEAIGAENDLDADISDEDSKRDERNDNLHHNGTDNGCREDEKRHSTSRNCVQSEHEGPGPETINKAEDHHEPHEGDNPTKADSLENTISETKKKAPTKAYQPRAKNAKEFFARKLDIEDVMKANRKREGTSTHNPRPLKLAKEGSWKDDKSNDLRANVINGAGGDFERAFNAGETSSMANINAPTHKARIEQIKASIPPGCDVRRATSQAKDIEQAKKSFGYKKITAKADGTWLLKGMKTGIFNHQLTLVAWMAGRECGNHVPLGGLVGDEMGMGKTIVSLFIIDGNSPSAQEIEEYSRATLVIVPNQSIAKQWQSEVEKHSSLSTSKLTVLFNKSKEPNKEYYQEQAIVITTYNEMLSQWISRERMKALNEEYKKDKNAIKRELTKQLGLLFQINWYRIILDEAHQIKNMKAQTTQACCFLQAKFRWALSGTPLANTAEEFFPYLQFLGCGFTENLAKFRETYIKGHQAQKHFETLVSCIMYRRTKKDEFIGHKILDVPDCQKLDIVVPMSMEESIIMETIECHYEAALSSVAKGTAGRTLTQKEENDKLAIIRAMYMMQRQACSHPFNIESWFRKSCSLGRLTILQEDLLNHCGTQTLLDQLQQKAPRLLGEFSAGVQVLRKLKNPTLSGCMNITFVLQCIVNEKRVATSTCPVCEVTPPAAPTFAKHCGHVYCEVCLLSEMTKVKYGMKCIVPGCTDDLDIGPDIETLDRASEGVQGLDTEQVHKSTQDSNSIILRRDKELSGMFVASEVNESLHTPPSMKLLATMAVILDWQKNHPADKIIVFTTFIMTGKMLGRMLKIAGLDGFLYYYGTIPQVKKDAAINEFKENAQKNILIMGLKCGALGLNLTVANRVIIVDPWWNNTVEEQAFGRVWRYGQKKVCHLVRIKSESSVDSRIAELQSTKAAEVNRALQDDGFLPSEINDSHVRNVFGCDEE